MPHYYEPSKYGQMPHYYEPSKYGQVPLNIGRIHSNTANFSQISQIRSTRDNFAKYIHNLQIIHSFEEKKNRFYEFYCLMIYKLQVVNTGRS